MSTPQTMGVLAFEEYCRMVGSQTYDGKPIPQWADLPVQVRQAWTSAAWVVVNETRKLMGHDPVDNSDPSNMAANESTTP